MTANLIVEIVELALTTAQAELNHGDAEDTLLDIVNKAIAAYEDHTGAPIDPSLIGSEEAL